MVYRKISADMKQHALELLEGWKMVEVTGARHIESQLGRQLLLLIRPSSLILCRICKLNLLLAGLLSFPFPMLVMLVVHFNGLNFTATLSVEIN